MTVLVILKVTFLYYCVQQRLGKAIVSVLTDNTGRLSIIV